MPKSRIRRKRQPLKSKGRTSALSNKVIKPAASPPLPAVVTRTDAERLVLWDHFFAALDLQMRERTTLEGHSGVAHPITCLGIDETESRLVVISEEGDGKGAALSQVDIQLSYPNFHVSVVRPVAISVPQFVRSAIDVFGVSKFSPEQLKGYDQQDAERRVQPLLEKFFKDDHGIFTKAFSFLKLSGRSQIQALARQLTSPEMIKAFSNIPESPTLSLVDILDLDVLAEDRHLGICGLPLFEFDETDYAQLTQGHVDDVKETLARLGILQFFFPPKDTSLLSVIDRRASKNPLSDIELLPTLGHPFGAREITSNANSLVDTIDQLRSLGYVTEIERKLVITPKGKEVREAIKLRPREGIISKLFNAIRVKLNIGVHFHDPG